MYIALHNRTAYSFGTALTTPTQLVAFAHEQDMPAIALTDLHGLYAAVEFQEMCADANIKPIFGTEMVFEEGLTVTLLAQTPRGYTHLCRLISRRYIETAGLEDLCGCAEEVVCMVGDHPSSFAPGGASRRGASFSQGLRPGLLSGAPAGRTSCTPTGLPEMPTSSISSGLPAGLTSCASSELPAGLTSSASTGPTFCVPGGLTSCAPAAKNARSVLGALREAFGDRLYIELAIHRDEDVPVARRRAARADALGIPVVATCESRCGRREQALMLRALASIGSLTLLDRPHPDKPEGRWHLRTPAEMQHLFRRRPDALANTFRIAEQCNVTLDMGRNRFPPFASPDGRSAMEHLRGLCIAGCRRRYVETPQQKGIGGRRPTLDEALQRLERELAIIDRVHYAEYFLIFHEIVEYCRRQKISSLARGSAADSLVCYVLGVSHACPFRFDLPFDRFLNVERAKFSKMADIDLDLPWDQREQVIRWVYERWGHDRVAMIGSPNTFHARAAVAELGKVFGIPPQEIHRITKRLPRTSADDLPHYLAVSPETRELPLDEEPYCTILQMAIDLEGLPRHWAMHPCGLVVSPEPLTDLIPLQPSPKNFLVAQHDMDAIEAMGFVKIDLLGQAGLSVLRDTVAAIERTDNLHIHLETDVDYSDAPTWQMIATGNARGVHHIESPAMTSLLQQCNCRDIDSLTAIVAIIRPGAANQGKKDTFARRHMGLEAPTYAHPSVVPVLEKTHGMMVFEEHILQIATEFAGMNLGQADVLRRGLNKQNARMIREMKLNFVVSAYERGRTPEEIKAVWSMVEGFRGFMFNKAHSAEYAVEAFQGAWLKLRWPAHYLAAILSNYRGFYAHSPTLPQILYVMEALRLGIRFLPPCVNRSLAWFSVESTGPVPGAQLSQVSLLTSRFDVSGSRCSILSSQFPSIRIPISHINGLAETFIERYQSEHEAGPFHSIEEFLDRCRPSESEALMLLDAGALDCFGSSRPELFWRLRRLLRQSAPGGPTLWSAHHTIHSSAPPIDLTPPDARQRAARETEILGFPVTLDPLTHLGTDDQGRSIDWSRYTPVNELARHRGQRVHVCGLMVADRISGALNGGLLKFVTLADHTGCLETILFPDVYQRFGHLTVAHPILAATGIVEPFETGTGFILRVQCVQSPAYKADELRIET